jgi:hypothetical protein
MTPMRWTVARAGSLVVIMGTCFLLGQFSIEFPGWTVLIMYTVALVGALIGLICAEFVRAK